MCGIAGYALSDADLDGIKRDLLMAGLGRAIEHRGTDATGVAYFRRNATGQLVTVKAPQRATKFFGERANMGAGASIALIHTRNATSGSPQIAHNNHPHAVGRTVLIHNGIINNDEPVFKALGHTAYSACDSEAAAAAISHRGPIGGMEMLAGWAAVGWVNTDEPDVLWLANLSGELFALQTPGGSLAFGSELSTIVNQDVFEAGLDVWNDGNRLWKITSGYGLSFNRSTGTLTWFNFDDDAGRRDYPSYGYPRYGNHGSGWDEEELRAITTGAKPSAFSKSDEPTDDPVGDEFSAIADAFDRRVTAMMVDLAEAYPRDAEEMDTDALRAWALYEVNRQDEAADEEWVSEARGDGQLIHGFNDEDDKTLVRVGDVISINGIAAEVTGFESADEVEVKWLDTVVPLSEHHWKILDQSNNT